MSQNYHGQIDLVTNQRHGQGTYVYNNRFFQYTGDWVQGVKHGQGLLMMKDGTTLEGNFVHGEITGFGIKRCPDGTTYTGDFVDGEFHGRGLLLCANGEKYDGEWADNKRQGSGELCYANGDTYIGRFKTHLADGHGTKESVHGEKYVGSWRAGRRHGEGILTWSNGSSYNGYWADDKKHGQGRYYQSANGVSYDGTWIHDQPERVAELIRIPVENVEAGITVKVNHCLPPIEVHMQTQDGETVSAESGRDIRISFVQITVTQPATETQPEKRTIDRIGLVHQPLAADADAIPSTVPAVSSSLPLPFYVVQMKTQNGVANFAKYNFKIPGDVKPGVYWLEATDLTALPTSPLAPYYLKVNVMPEQEVPTKSSSKK